MTMARAPLLAVLLIALALLAPTAHAVYVMTPLRLTPVDSEGDVGDELGFQVEPDPESDRSYAGATVRLRYEWDPDEGNESAPPDEPTSDADVRRGTGPSVTLDAKGQGTFTWTIPAEVDDRNVALSLIDDAGEAVAFAYLRVGDAEPQFRTMVGGGPGGAIEPGEHATTPQPTGRAEDTTTNDTLAPAPFAALAVLALAAIAARRRR